MRRVLATVVVAAGVAAALPHAAAGQGGAVGWDGQNPFECTLQQLGTGTAFPYPDADPFCVEYDKRHQNVTELGVVEFLSKEPARVAAAGPKCFYFQRDHWVGSVVQGNQQTQTYAWDGSYYYDKSRGTGGVYVENFSFNGQSGDPSQVPGFPSQYKPYFSNGRGGVQADNDVPVDPSCAAKAKAHSPYAANGPGGGAGTSGMSHCRVPGGHVRRGAGGVVLGERRSRVRSDLGPASAESIRYVTYCMTGGGKLVAGFAKSGASGRVAFVYVDAPPFDVRKIRTGGSASKARKRLGHHRTRKAGSVRVMVKRERRQLFLIGVAGGKVAFLAVAPRRAKVKRALRFYKQMPR